MNKLLQQRFFRLISEYLFSTIKFLHRVDEANELAADLRQDYGGITALAGLL